MKTPPLASSNLAAPSAAVVFSALLAVVIWGASAVAAKFALADMTPWTVAILRTVVGGAVTLPIALALRLPLPANGRTAGGLLLAAFCGYIAFPVMATIGIAQTSVNHTSMIFAILPVLSGAIALAWDRRAPSRGWLIGCAIALLGEVWLIFGASGEADKAAGATVQGDLIIAGSCLLAATGYVVGARVKAAGYSAVALTFWGVTAASIALVPAMFFPTLFVGADLRAASAESWGAILFMAIGVTIVGYALWYWALGAGGVARIGPIQFLQPISGVALAAALLGETPTLSFLFAALAILGGVIIAVRSSA